MRNFAYLNEAIRKQREEDKINFESMINGFKELNIDIYTDESRKEIKSINKLLNELKQEWTKRL